VDDPTAGDHGEGDRMAFVLRSSAEVRDDAFLDTQCGISTAAAGISCTSLGRVEMGWSGSKLG
jgi:hypothetical protein